MKVLWQILWTLILIPSFNFCMCMGMCALTFKFSSKAILKVQIKNELNEIN